MQTTSNIQSPKGFLKYFLFLLFVGALNTLIRTIIQFKSIDLTKIDYTFFLGITASIIQSGGTIALAIYTVYSFLTGKNNAVSLGKLYLILIFVINLLAGLTSQMSYGTTNWVALCFVPITCAGCFLYLCFSEQVNELYPKEKRVTKDKDILFFCIPALIPALYILSSLFYDAYQSVQAQMITFQDESAQFDQDTVYMNPVSMEPREIRPGEHSDGRTYFFKPGDLKFREDSSQEGVHRYVMTGGDSISILLMSDVYTTHPSQYFKQTRDSYIEKNESPDFTDLEYDVIKLSSGYKLIRRTVLYYDKTPHRIWSFNAVFDDEDLSKNVTIISYKKTGNSTSKELEYLDELIESIQF